MAELTNSISLRTNFNQAPYNDDFNEAKNFYRILYNPTRPVQSRELTQSQTIAQNQLARLANHIFKDGSRVSGGEFNIDTTIKYVRVDDEDALANTVDVDNFANSTIVGGTTNISAKVIIVADGTEAAAPDTKTFLIRYTSANTSGATEFAAGETLTANNGFEAIVAASAPVGNASMFTVKRGTIYAKGHIIYHDEQAIILDKYSPTPSYVVGMTIKEEIITSFDDNSLLDPALGGSSYLGPGADRLKLSAILTKYDLANTAPPQDFVHMFTIKDGIVQDKAERPLYSEIRDELARRTFDESGHYVVKGMRVRLREHLDNGENNGYLELGEGGNTSRLVAGVEPGICYVKGYDLETLVTKWVDIDKGIDYKYAEDVTVAPNYGNYVIIDECLGNWDTLNGAAISIYDTAQNAVTDRDGSGLSPTGSVIGTARARAIQHYSGTPGTPDCQYALYLYDIAMSANSFAFGRSLYIDNASGTDGVADIVLTANTASVVDSAFRSLVYRLPVSGIRRLRDSTNSIDSLYQFYQGFDATIATNGLFTLTTGASEPWPFSVGALNTAQKRENIVVALNSTVDTANITGTVTVYSTNTLVLGSGTGFSTRLNVGNLIKVNSQTRRIVSIADDTHLQVDSAFSANSAGQNLVKTYLAGHILDLGEYGTSGSTRTVTAASSTSLQFDLKETLGSAVTAKVLAVTQKVDGREKAKLRRASRLVQINIATHANGTSGPWSLGFADVFRINSVRRKTGSGFSSTSEGTDVTTQFTLDDGQLDGFYELSSLKKKTGTTVGGTDYLLIDLDYFYQDRTLGEGYFSMESYPIDDVSSSNTSAIRTWEIPIFTSPLTGIDYDLRNCIDFRQRKDDTAADATVVGSMTTNPAASTTFDVAAGGLIIPKVNEDFQSDLSYYLPRKDLVAIDVNGRIQVVRGIPRIGPITPATPSDTMALAVITVPPYPSMPSSEAMRVERPDYASSSKQVSNRRYTMRDIGVLDQRLTSLEYYTALSLLEKNTLDMNIPDADGLDRFKNGILVDPFTSHNIGDIYNVDYRIAIDPKKQELRPKAKLAQVGVVYDEASSTNVARRANDATLIMTTTVGDNFDTDTWVYQGVNFASATAKGLIRHRVDDRIYVEQVTGTFGATTLKGNISADTMTVSSSTLPTKSSLLSLPYTHAVYSSQPFATTTRNIAGLQWSWIGYMQLVPSVDVWNDMTQLPDIHVEDTSVVEEWLARQAAWEIEWSSWDVRWTGETSTGRARQISSSTEMSTEGDQATITTTFSQTVTRTGTQSRTGLQLVVTPGEIIQTETSSALVDVSIVPWMRARKVLVRAQGMKPNSRLYPYFDGEDIGAYCTPISTTDAWDYFTEWGNIVDSNNFDGPVVLNSIDNDFTPAPTGTSVTTGSVVTNPAWYDDAWLGSPGDNVYADSEGRVLLFFDIPNNESKRFPVGQKMFRLSDSPTNSSTRGQYTTTSQALYVAHGLNKIVQDTITSTRGVNIAYEQVTQTEAIEETTVNTWTEETFVQQIDPVAQEFFVSAGIDQRLPGQFFSKVDLYFASKDATLPVIVQIREMESTSAIGISIVPFSETVIYPDDIHVSDDGSAATTVVFPGLVYLKSNTTYALVIIPAGGSPNYTIWTSVLGETDLLTGVRVIERPAMGNLFVSSNDRSYSIVQDERMKVTFYRADFSDVTGTAYFDNDRRAFLEIEDQSGTSFNLQEQVRGNLTLFANTVSGTVNVGDYIWGGTSNAYGEILSIPSSKTYVIEEKIPGRTFQLTESLTFKFSNEVATGATGNVHTINGAVGYADFYFHDSYEGTTRLHLRNVSDTAFANTMIVRGQTSNTSATVSNTDGLQMDVLHTQIRTIVPINTTLDWYVKPTTADSPPTLDTTWEQFESNQDHLFEVQKVVLSATDEDTYISDKSLQLRSYLNTETTRLSPIIDLLKMGALIIGNDVNNDSTGETDPSGGNARARYLTRIVTLAEDQDAEDLELHMAVYRPPNSTVLVYARYLHREDSDIITSHDWTLLEVVGNEVFSSSENREDFRDWRWRLPVSVLTGDNEEVEYVNSEGITFLGYKFYAVKIVLLSSNTAIPPRCKQMRVVALQK